MARQAVGFKSVFQPQLKKINRWQSSMIKTASMNKANVKL